MRQLVILALTVFSLSGCSEATAEKKVVDSPLVVKLSSVIAANDMGYQTYPAEVAAVKTLDISFEVAGRINQMALRSGASVRQGELIASVDPIPFEQRVQEFEIRLSQAKRDLTRIESMYQKGLVSQSQLDSAKTARALTDVELARARRDLNNTKLIAPFNAQVAERLVERAAYIQPGEAVARIQDVSQIYFHVSLPERVVSTHIESLLTDAKAELLTYPGQQFPVKYVEHATQPDPVTQTYQVVFAMPASKDRVIQPGARARLSLKFSTHKYKEGMAVPLSALVSDDKTNFTLWRYNAEQSNVSPVAVDVVGIVDDIAIVNGALSSGDTVVAAGASKMRTGLLVKPYQAEL